MKEIIKIEKLPLNNAEIEKWEEAREKCLFNFSEVEKLEKEMLFELLECALFKIDSLQNNSKNNQSYIDIIDELFVIQIEVLKALFEVR